MQLVCAQHSRLGVTAKACRAWVGIIKYKAIELQMQSLNKAAELPTFKKMHKISLNKLNEPRKSVSETIITIPSNHQSPHTSLMILYRYKSRLKYLLAF